MKYTIDVAYKSLFKHGEELCGDKVAVARTQGSTICVLADGLGSGVKANILATLTSQIIVTMLREGATMQEAVETIAGTLPVCSVRKVAYSTFSVLQITDEGEAYLVEFDNPFCLYVREGRLVQLPCEYREFAGKGVYESRFRVQPGDSLTLVSDGVVYAGVGQTLNFGWTWESVADWLVRTVTPSMSALRLASLLSQAVYDLYMGQCGDDSTVLCVRVQPRRAVSLLASPPKDPAKDADMVGAFMRAPGRKVVCGGSSANMVGRELGLPVTTELTYSDPSIPPIGHIKGIDLVTEGVLTMARTLELLRGAQDAAQSDAPFKRLDEDNGAARLARLLLEDCTHLQLFVGTAINPAHQNPNLPTDLSIKFRLIDELAAELERLGKTIERQYF